MKGFKFLAFSALLFWGIIFFIKPASAVIISPTVIDHEAAPGMSVSGKLRFTHTDSRDQTYYIIVQKFAPWGEEGLQTYLPEDDIQGLPSWFDINGNSYTLSQGETKEVDYTISIPPNAEPGGHYAAVFISTSPEDPEEESGVGMGARTGVLFLVNVSGEVTEQANLESFKTNKKIFSHLPANLSLRIKNTGNVHLRPKGSLEVRNMWGGIVARVEANPGNSAVLPNSIRRINTWWIKSEKIAEGGFTAGLINEWRNFALGKYTATVNVKYGSKNVPLEEASTSFWVIPWRMLTILLVLIVVFLIVMKFYNKAVVSSAMKKSSKKK
ncbi:MAG: hypothetical protein ACOYUZ_04275 [Patescibacteria group bacterium]